MKDKAYLFVYSFTNFINGIIAHTAGPLIPFLAASSHIPPTNFYFLFISRSAGAIVGAILYKILQHFNLAANHHRILGLTSVLLLLTLVLFQFWHTTVGMGILIGIYSSLCFAYGTALNCSVLIVPSKEDIFFWLSISNGIFGVGCLLGPLFVDLFQLRVYTFYAVLVLPISVLYLFILKSPQ